MDDLMRVRASTALPNAAFLKCDCAALEITIVVDEEGIVCLDINWRSLDRTDAYERRE